MLNGFLIRRPILILYFPTWKTSIGFPSASKQIFRLHCMFSFLSTFFDIKRKNSNNDNLDEETDFLSPVISTPISDKAKKKISFDFRWFEGCKKWTSSSFSSYFQVIKLPGKFSWKKSSNFPSNHLLSNSIPAAPHLYKVIKFNCFITFFSYRFEIATQCLIKVTRVDRGIFYKRVQ